MNITKAYLFCIAIRCIPIIMFYILNKNIIPSITYPLAYLISIIYCIIGLLFLLKAFTFNKKQKGFFGNKVWWNELRYFHGIIYILNTILLIYFKNINVIICSLIFDLLIGIISFRDHYFI